MAKATTRQARLALADGTVYRGIAIGADGDAVGELVFNTTMSGYEEILTDPSYSQQIVALTYPEIGNYGFTATDAQGARSLAAGLVVKNASPEPSNFRAKISLGDWLRAQNIVGISGIDTRALTRRLRSKGAVQAVISTGDASDDSLIQQAREASGLEGRDLVSTASTPEAYSWTEGTAGILPNDALTAPETRFKVTVVDFGVRRGILRQLVDSGCSVRVVPFDTAARDILADSPHGVLLSNGPGDPAAVSGGPERVKELLGAVPLMGMGLGYQLLALALGATTRKLPTGHHDANHPVKDESSGAVEITVHNHAFAVDAESLEGKAKITHRSLFDGTVEGLELPNSRAFGIQYEPEASASMGDTRHPFVRFTRLMEGAPQAGD